MPTIHPGPAGIAEVISIYTRAQAVEDGVLVDLMQPETVAAVKEAGFRWPVAMTSGSFHLTVAVPYKTEIAGGLGRRRVRELVRCCDLQGRLWDVLWMLNIAIRRASPGETILFFEVRCVTPESPKQLRVVRLKSVVGPGDDGEPVITIMLPDED